MRNGHLKWRCAAGVLGKGATQGHGHAYGYPLLLAAIACNGAGCGCPIQLDGCSVRVVQLQAAASSFIFELHVKLKQRTAPCFMHEFIAKAAIDRRDPPAAPGTRGRSPSWTWLLGRCLGARAGGQERN